MKRFHVHVSVSSLDRSIPFYSALFGSAPSVHKPDYAKWVLEQPQLNFAISMRPGGKNGIDHLGIQVSEADELDALQQSLVAANIGSAAEVGANCCYAHSDKHWLKDPEGIVWEAFHTMAQAATYGNDRGPDALARSDMEAAVTDKAASPAKASCCPSAAAGA
ncbi:MAG: ArsI/CadI family heavy metal resistance metalloenzyme [Lysobacterales bacterium]